MQGFRPVAGQAKAVGCHAVSQEMDTTAAWRRCKDSSHCVRGKRESWRWRAPPPNSRADCNVDVGPGVETAKSRISLHLGQRNNVQGTKYYSVSLPRHFHFQATSLVPDSQRPSRFSISLQVHLQCCCRSPAVDPSLFSRLLGAGECFFGPLLCDGTRGNKFRPIAPYATDWCLK